MFYLTISFIVVFIFSKLAFLGAQLNLMIVMFCSEQVLPCYRAATHPMSLSAQVALSCTEQIGFISDLPCHWGLVWRPLGSWTILSPSHHSAGLTGAPLIGEDTVPACLDSTSTLSPCRAALSMHWHLDFIKPLCSGVLFYVRIRSSELISVSNLGMGPSDKTAPKTWRNVSQRKCNTTDLRHGRAFTAVVSTGMPMTFCTGTVHLCLFCTAQSCGSSHKTVWVIDFSVLPTKKKKKKNQASFQTRWNFFHLFISRRIKKN